MDRAFYRFSFGLGFWATRGWLTTLQAFYHLRRVWKRRWCLGTKVAVWFWWFINLFTVSMLKICLFQLKTCGPISPWCSAAFPWSLALDTEPVSLAIWLTTPWLSALLLLSFTSSRLSAARCSFRSVVDPALLSSCSSPTNYPSFPTPWPTLVHTSTLNCPSCAPALLSSHSQPAPPPISPFPPLCSSSITLDPALLPSADATSYYRPPMHHGILWPPHDQWPMALLGKYAALCTCCRTLYHSAFTLLHQTVLVLDSLHQVIAPPAEVFLLVKHVKLLPNR